jgi:hypothetical protein
MRLSLPIAVFSAAIGAASPAFPQGATDPAEFVRIIEQTTTGRQAAVSGTYAEVDDQSVIRLVFDHAKMAVPAKNAAGVVRPRVHVRVEVYTQKGSSRSPVAPLPHYVDLVPPPAAGSPGDAAGTVVYHDKYYNPEIGAAIVPSTEFMLRGTQAGSADSIEIRVTNLMTQESVLVILIPRQFGFRVRVSDSLMFVKRLGVGAADRAAGIEPFNFGPSPGVTYGGTYLARKNALARFLQPGVGINLLFTRWGQPSFDLATGKFVNGTNGSNIQVGLGCQWSLFGNVLQFTYGANLHVDQKRQYFGIGVSFVNLSSKIAGLIGK